MLVLFSSTICLADAVEPSISSFSQTKSVLEKVYKNKRTTFYCGCSYDENRLMNYEKCGYLPRSISQRSKRQEWEHVVPAESFGQSFVVWRKGHASCVDSHGKPFRGRRCAHKTNKTYREMESNPHNVVPAIGEVNARRSNFSMSMIPGETRAYGSCDIEIENRKFEPGPSRRGDIARIYFYMESRYPGRGVISKKNRKLFRAWSKMDPVDAEECARSEGIFNLTSIKNMVIEKECNALLPLSGRFLADD